MRKLTSIDRIKLIGFFSFIIATLIITVIIPAVNNRISKIEEDIIEFRDYRILHGLCKLDNEAHLARRKINIFEANQVVYISELEKSINELYKKDTTQVTESKKRINELRQKVLNQIIGLAEWTNIGDRENTTKKIFDICDDGTSTLEEKIKRVEKIFNANRAIDSSKLERKHRERDKNKAIKETFENWKSLWSKWFAVLQISGLILFSGAEVIDKLIKKE